MPTTIVKTIGTSSRDYSTLAAWIAACPANLVTADQIWQGQCYNDAEFVGSGTRLTISGITTDATRYVELTTGAGQSFQDNAGVQTNALKYNVSNGVGIRTTSNYTAVLVNGAANTRINKLQIKCSSGSGAQGISDNAGTVTLKDLVITGDGSAPIINLGTNNGSILANILAFVSGSGTSAIFNIARNNTLIGCALVRTTDQSAAGTGIAAGNYGTTKVNSCAIFGFTTPFSGGGTTTGSSNNATDQASGLPGTSNQFNVTFNSTTPFTNSSVASQDCRAVASTALAASGFLDSTNAPNDISATARANPPTIGVWELTGAAPTFIASKPLILQQAVNRAATY